MCVCVCYYYWYVQFDLATHAESFLFLCLYLIPKDVCLCLFVSRYACVYIYINIYIYIYIYIYNVLEYVTCPYTHTYHILKDLLFHRSYGDRPHQEGRVESKRLSDHFIGHVCSLSSSFCLIVIFQRCTRGAR
jgi:hypothetical protein